MRIGRTLLLACTLITSVGATAALAGPPGQGYSILYLDDAGNEVGGATASCGGQFTSWGVRTSNSIKRTWACD